MLIFMWQTMLVKFGYRGSKTIIGIIRSAKLFCHFIGYLVRHIFIQSFMSKIELRETYCDGVLGVDNFFGGCNPIFANC